MKKHEQVGADLTMLSRRAMPLGVDTVHYLVAPYRRFFIMGGIFPVLSNFIEAWND